MQGYYLVVFSMKNRETKVYLSCENSVCGVI